MESLPSHIHNARHLGENGFPLGLLTQTSGISICHPIYDNKAMTQVLRHAIYFATLNTDATATFMFLPASAGGITAPIPGQSNPKLQLKVAVGSCQVQDGKKKEKKREKDKDGKTFIGAGVYHPMCDSKNLVEPNGAGMTNTIGRAEPAAIAAALTHEHTHMSPQTASAHFTNSESKPCI
eukprot:1160727-Pelagomonas_calceolata.AAC.25